MHSRKLNKKTMIGFLIFVVLNLFIFLTRNNHLEMLIITLEFLYIFKIAFFSYFTVFSFIFWFSFLQEYFASIDVASAAGRLAWDTSIPIYHTELFACIVFLFTAEICLFLTTNVLENEREIYMRKIAIKKNTAIIYAFAAFFLIVLAYPSLPTLGANLTRDTGLLPSSFVVPLAMLALAVTYNHLKSSVFLKIITFLSLFWVVFHGDRVIVLGYLVYFSLRFMNEGKFRFKSIKSVFKNKKVIVLIIVALAVAVIFIRVQTTRDGADYNLTFAGLINNILKQGTAGDVVYAFNCSVDMWKSGKGMMGRTYLYYVMNILPRADQSLYPALVLMNSYDSLGGGLYFVEPMMNGGLVLTFVETVVFLIVMAWVMSKKTNFGTFLVIPFILLIFRFSWYATFAGVVKMLLYYVPFLYYGARKLNSLRSIGRSMHHRCSRK